MVRLALRLVWHGLAVIGLVAVMVAVVMWRQGIATREAPGAVETAVARAARHAMIPAADRARRNPEAATAANLRSGLEHWADHCASCHGNDGSGATAVGQALYPRAPDMRRAETQTLTDGELFYIIENGVKLTGMPAWGDGTAEGEAASWHLVQFVRRLPELTDVELAEMEELNPRSEADWRALEEERRFLAGETPAPQASSPEHRHKGESQ